MPQAAVPPPAPQPQPATAVVPMLCPQCYQPVPPGAHFCPNCGKKLVGDADLPLSTSVTSQILLYGFSIVLPAILFLAITKWQGITYIKSSNSKAQQMGWIALALIIISTIFTGWYYTREFDQLLQGATSTAGLSSLGY